MSFEQVATAVAILGTFYMLRSLWVLFAGMDKMCTVRDMQSKGPAFRRGIPLNDHWAMKYADALLPLLMAYIVATYASPWTFLKVMVMIIVGMGLSYGLHMTYIEAGKKFPEVTTYGGKLTMAGQLHLGYMGLAFAIFGLFYLCTPRPDPLDVAVTSIWLVLHVIVGVHVPLKLMKPERFPYHGIMDAGTLAPIAGTMVAVSGLSWWALR